MKLQIFNQVNFLKGIKALFKDLKVPMNYVADEPTTAKEILKDTYKDNDSFQLMDDIYFVGMVDDAAFEGNKSLEAEKIKSDYDGILIFGVTLKSRPNGLLPTRSQLAEISRAFNREFYYTPVVVVFKYGNYLAFANTERLKYKQEWREGEKAGKVSLLRDVHIEKPHSGHERILAELQIPTTGTKKVDSFSKLYAYWQEVFSVSLLNKKFYQELSNWYFWATQHVIFPGQPSEKDAYEKDKKLEELLQEHRATNVIRMLTRLLFVWFIKEKKLIPEELFELDALQKDILKEISPYHERGMFKERNKESIYYKAILQNLFFATLNCPIEADSLDKRKRGFRGDGYGTHRGIDYLMRYKQYFKNPEAFLEKLNKTVPFLNGGLFECLDDKFNNIYIDGFSDQMTKGEKLIVPDYLFFGVEEETDLSDIVGISDKKYKQAAVKGLINILKSYKFTITENTPIEEDVALDPELLGKVFENLLASYNPETKTTARKQTGSFYTPREIVNYMVDESLIAYLKNAISDWGGLDDEALDRELHVLTSFDSKVPFTDNTELQRAIITVLSSCTILDPACGSGAFPMGILQKMVHILQKLDPNNKVWKEVQLAKAEQESKAAFEIEDKQAREERLLEINEAFDQSINDPDYARKLFLIENCIYGVDIQPIATQISKLRFFISLVVEQKVNPEKNNFGIRPLPNLETKFVAANTLIGIEKPKEGFTLNIFDGGELKQLEAKLKKVRSKLFSAKSKETKLKYREEDKVLRNQIAEELEKSGWKSDTAQNLAGWDPYAQNDSSSFFDPEWMFDVKEGFDVVIGNPPYISYYGNTGAKLTDKERLYIVDNYFHVQTKNDRINSMNLMTEKAMKILKPKGVVFFITNKTQAVLPSYKRFREYILTSFKINSLVDHLDPFEAIVDCIILGINKESESEKKLKYFSGQIDDYSFLSQEDFKSNPQSEFAYSNNNKTVQAIEKHSKTFDQILTINRGVNIGGCFDDFLSDVQYKGYYPYLGGTRNIKPFNYKVIEEDGYFKFDEKLETELRNNGATIVLGNPERYTIPHLFIPESGQRIMAAFCTEQIYGSYGLLIGTNPENENLTKASCSILNSSIITFYCIERGILRKGNKATPHVGVRGLNKVPIPSLSDRNIELLAVLCDLATFSWAFSLNSLFEQIVNSAVFNLYFPDHMKERGINVLEFVERDISEVMQGREFEKLSDAEKEQVIEQLHAKWSHPDNEVRDRIKLFAVRSPEILKPILEN
ncbi:Eco57I restriction-modification methylase domain-containing protein [Algoriphagus formosus]|uniref:Eco57I restriction-modification methylase domain-containing protein n=1 Tax=Algoriphagus formosus TaxID=2007308 RepID=UPI000C2828D7|nr:TaqI-like C-terminal specificity domain-containing protein [Algoriphagus formosus]